MTVAAIIQARAGSTRLPGKVLKPIRGRPMLEHVIRRVAAAKKCDVVCVATTTKDRDDVIVEIAGRCGAQWFRGSEADVLSRYVGAARRLGGDLVVRVTSDCPLYDPELLDEMLAARQMLAAATGPVDYYSNFLVRTYPRGLETEIVPLAVLERAWRESDDSRAREHVTWGIYQRPESYRLENHLDLTGADHSAMRWTVDTPEDFDFVEQVYEALHARDPLFGRESVYALLGRRPELAHINAGIEQKPIP